MAPPQPPPQAAEPIVLLGKYYMGRVLGRGSFAKVHVARSVQNDAVVAIKVIDKKKTVDAAMEANIIGEIAAMRRLHRHPNVIQIHEVLATKSKIYLVMEYAVGGELFSKLLRCGKLREATARRYFQQLASAMRFCHENGVAHRDVKPQNLLLDKNGNLKVSDFGLSSLSEQIGDCGLLRTACGTPAYAAPEVVARRRGGYDGAKADAWSCGVILFVLLAGFLPFDDRNIILMYKKMERREYKFPEWISKPARSIIYRLLDPNPDTRMSIEEAMQSRWFNKKSEKSNTDNNSNNKNDNQILITDTKLAVETINAFDIISLSSGLDLSALFEADKRKGKRFTASVKSEEVVERVSEIGERLGYEVENKKGGAVRLRRGAAVVAVETMEITEAAAVVVDVKVVEGGVVVDEKWEELMHGLEEIVLSWHNDVA